MNLIRYSRLICSGGLVISIVVIGQPLIESAQAGGAPPIFNDGFENARDFLDLFPPDASRWHGFQIQPSRNIVDLTMEQVHSGEQALKCFAQPFDGIKASKADILRSLLIFADGAEVWTEYFVYIVGGTVSSNVFLWDLEATKTCTTLRDCPEKGEGTICSSPGRRLYLSGPDGDWIVSDLGKWCINQDFGQPPGEEIHIPKDQWVRLRVYMKLSHEPDGLMMIWQDDNLIIDAVGITLPRADSIYDRLQVGITANGNEAHAHIVYIDDVSIWDAPPAWWTATPGDIDGDGVVSVSDLLILLSAWGTCPDCDDCQADLDDDCIVGTSDLLILLGHWG